MTEVRGDNKIQTPATEAKCPHPRFADPLPSRLALLREARERANAGMTAPSRPGYGLAPQGEGLNWEDRSWDGLRPNGKGPVLPMTPIRASIGLNGPVTL